MAKQNTETNNGLNINQAIGEKARRVAALAGVVLTAAAANVSPAKAQSLRGPESSNSAAPATIKAHNKKIDPRLLEMNIAGQDLQDVLHGKRYGKFYTGAVVVGGSPYRDMVAWSSPRLKHPGEGIDSEEAIIINTPLVMKEGDDTILVYVDFFSEGKMSDMAAMDGKMHGQGESLDPENLDFLSVKQIKEEGGSIKFYAYTGNDGKPIKPQMVPAAKEGNYMVPVINGSPMPLYDAVGFEQSETIMRKWQLQAALKARHLVPTNVGISTN